MKQINRKLSVLIGVIFLVSLILQLTVYFNMKNMVDDEVEKRAAISDQLMKVTMGSWLSACYQIIESSEIYIQGNLENREGIRKYLAEQLMGNTTFSSLYYGTEKNQFITGGPWVPTVEFNVKDRPWYIKAVKERRVVVTDPFLNASGDAWIVSIAMPVMTQEGHVIGVVGGDVPLSTIDGQVENTFSAKGEAVVFVRVNGEVITRKKAEELPPLVVSLKNEYLKSVSAHPSEKGRTAAVRIEGKKGFFSYQQIGQDDLVVLRFSPIAAYGYSTIQLINTLLILLGSMIGFYFLCIGLQKKHIAMPLAYLEHSIDRIDISRDMSYRILIGTGHGFESLAEKINGLLSEIQRDIQKIHEDKEEIQSLNEEMEASLEQLIATDQELQSQKLSFEALFRNSSSGIVLVDGFSRIMDCNSHFEILSGCSLADVQNKSIGDLLSLWIPNSDISELFAQKDIPPPPVVETALIAYADQEVVVSIQTVPLQDNNWERGGYLIFTDITQKSLQMKEMAYVSTHDSHTGLFNRDYFNQMIEIYSDNYHKPISIIIADLNGLKLMNDAFGQKKGDELLLVTAEIIRGACRHQDIVCRIGGDEFAILLPDTNIEVAESIAKRIICLVEQTSCGDLQLSISVGWAETSLPKITLQDAIKSAEDFLYQRKLTESPSVRGKTMHAIIKSLHEKSEREAMHSRRVRDLCQKFGECLQLSEREQIELTAMGHLHDLGKIGIDEKILNKPGVLTEEEYAEMKRHPEIGYRILSAINEMSDIANCILAHHERWDGKGYPLGLKGSEIPYLAQVVSVIDSFDAMTSNRTYRNALSEADALMELQRCAGTQFSPQVVTDFIHTLQKGNIEQDVTDVI